MTPTTPTTLSLVLTFPPLRLALWLTVLFVPCWWVWPVALGVLVVTFNDKD